MRAPSPAVPGPGPLARLLSHPRVRVAEADPRLVRAGEGLLEEEARAVEHAVHSRRQQYTAGRQLARHALAELGEPSRPLLNDGQRAPMWPAGIVGTITHTQTWCAVAVARACDVAAIGADVEVASPLEAGLWQRICLPEERELLTSRPPEQAGLLAKVVFSAKESAYKALYPRVRTFLDFQGMHIALHASDDSSRWTFRAQLRSAWGNLPPGYVIGNGDAWIGPDLIVTAIIP